MVANCCFVSINYVFFGAGSNTPECEAYRAQMRAIDAANRAAMAAYQISSQLYIIIALRAWGERYSSALGSLWQSF